MFGSAQPHKMRVGCGPMYLLPCLTCKRLIRFRSRVVDLLCPSLAKRAPSMESVFARSVSPVIAVAHGFWRHTAWPSAWARLGMHGRGSVRKSNVCATASAPGGNPRMCPEQNVCRPACRQGHKHPTANTRANKPARPANSTPNHVFVHHELPLAC
jgi:hypothetical protein